MSDARYDLVLREDRVHLVLHGSLEAESLPSVANALDALLAEIAEGSRVLVDLGNLERCDPAARRTLARIQRRLRDRGCRTAWLAQSPRLRGLALWVVYAANDPRATPVGDVDLAEAWLEGTEARLSDGAPFVPVGLDDGT
jgi:ABC-type transporter Mla MlaB component